MTNAQGKDRPLTLLRPQGFLNTINRKVERKKLQPNKTNPLGCLDLVEFPHLPYLVRHLVEFPSAHLNGLLFDLNLKNKNISINTQSQRD